MEEVLHEPEQVEREEDAVREALQNGEAAFDVFNRFRRF
jgi:hypothetical protein